MLPSMGRRHPLLSPLPGKPSPEDENSPTSRGALIPRGQAPGSGGFMEPKPQPLQCVGWSLGPYTASTTRQPPSRCRVASTAVFRPTPSKLTGFTPVSPGWSGSTLRGFKSHVERLKTFPAFSLVRGLCRSSGEGFNLLREGASGGIVGAVARSDARQPARNSRPYTGLIQKRAK